MPASKQARGRMAGSASFCAEVDRLKRLKFRFTLRSLLFVVGSIAVTLGASREWTRIQYYRSAARHYRSEVEHKTGEAVLLTRSCRYGDANECLQRAEVAGSLARWYSSHILTGGNPPPDPDPKLEGWSIPEACKRAGVILAGKAIKLGWWGTDATFEVTRVFKGTPRNPELTTVSTRFIQTQAARMRMGKEYLVFYMEDYHSRNPALRVFEQTQDNVADLEAECYRQ
jgi:hypothetical protein